MIHEATRTLVKSPPEVWEQCSDAQSLSRHLSGTFGEIRITRLEPESTVAWEGEHGSGTVTIEPSAWGTRVTLTAETEEEAEQEAAPEVELEPPRLEPAPEPQSRWPEPAAPARPREPLMRLLMRLWHRRAMVQAAPSMPVQAAAEPEPQPASEVEPESVAQVEPEPRSAPQRSGSPILLAALESLGQAHHRPYSRG